LLKEKPPVSTDGFRREMCNPLDGDMPEFTYTTANIPDSDPHAESIWTIVIRR